MVWWLLGATNWAHKIHFKEDPRQNACHPGEPIVEVEALLNDHPLTHSSPDIGDPEAITPSHLLHGRRITTLPHVTTEDDEIPDPNLEIYHKSDIEQEYMQSSSSTSGIDRDMNI